MLKTFNMKLKVTIVIITGQHDWIYNDNDGLSKVLEEGLRLFISDCFLYLFFLNLQNSPERQPPNVVESCFS